MAKIGLRHVVYSELPQKNAKAGVHLLNLWIREIIRDYYPFHDGWEIVIDSDEKLKTFLAIERILLNTDV